MLFEKGPVEINEFIESGGEYLGEERGFEMYNILHAKKMKELQEERARKEGKSEAVENDKQEKLANDKYLVQPSLSDAYAKILAHRQREKAVNKTSGSGTGDASSGGSSGAVSSSGARAGVSSNTNTSGSGASSNTTRANSSGSSSSGKSETTSNTNSSQATSRTGNPGTSGNTTSSGTTTNTKTENADSSSGGNPDPVETQSPFDSAYSRGETTSPFPSK